MYKIRVLLSVQSRDCAVPIKLIHSYNRAMYKIRVPLSVQSRDCAVPIKLNHSYNRPMHKGEGEVMHSYHACQGSRLALFLSDSTQFSARSNKNVTVQKKFVMKYETQLEK